jgi:EmrB/QacA subfamily drug resistance transporter
MALRRARTDSTAPALDAALVRTAVVVVLGSIMTILDTTIVAVALDTLGRSFKTSVATIQWVSTGYLLALAIAIPATSWMVNTFGAKRAWMTSVLLFIVGSALCGIAWSPTSLIIFRVLQGAGGGMVLPIGQSILATEAGPARMGRVMGFVGVPSLLGPVLGPVLGGLILAHFSWRWIFFVNVPIGIVALALAARHLQAPAARTRARFDLLGFMMISPGLALIVYALADAGGSQGFANSAVIVDFILGVGLLVGFVVRSLRTPTPLLELRLFANRDFRVASICAALAAGSIFATMFLLPLYYQVVRGLSPLHAALFLIPQACGAMCMMPIAGSISDRAGPRRVTVIGLGVMAVATFVFTRVGANTNEGLLFGAQFFRGIGFGLAMIPMQAAALRHIEHHHLPAASTLNNILQRIGSAIAVALVAVVLTMRLKSTVHAVTISQVSVHSEPRVLGLVADAFGTSYWWNFAFVIAALASTMFLTKREAIDPLATGNLEIRPEANLSEGAG